MPAGYNGTDRGHFTVLPEPEVKAGASFKVGFLNANAGQPILLAMQKAAQAEAEKLGGSFIALDAASNPQTQASQLQQLIAQHVNVIIGNPVVSAALGPGIAQARATPASRSSPSAIRRTRPTRRCPARSRPSRRASTTPSTGR